MKLQWEQKETVADELKRIVPNKKWRKFTRLNRLTITMSLLFLLASLTLLNAADSHEKLFQLKCSDRFVLDDMMRLSAGIDFSGV